MLDYIPYEALNNDDEELAKKKGTRRKNLFKYDLAHKLARGQTQHLAMLWVEGEQTAYHKDQWSALGESYTQRDRE